MQLVQQHTKKNQLIIYDVTSIFGCFFLYNALHCSNRFVSLPELGGNKWSFLGKKVKMRCLVVVSRIWRPACEPFMQQTHISTFICPPTIDNGPIRFLLVCESLPRYTAKTTGGCRFLGFNYLALKNWHQRACRNKISTPHIKLFLP